MVKIASFMLKYYFIFTIFITIADILETDANRIKKIFGNLKIRRKSNKTDFWNSLQDFYVIKS